MSTEGLGQKDFTGAAEKALKGDIPGAVQALTAVLVTAASGQPLLGVPAGVAVGWVAGRVLDTGTRRLEQAERQYDDEQAKREVSQFQRTILHAGPPSQQYYRPRKSCRRHSEECECRRREWTA